MVKIKVIFGGCGIEYIDNHGNTRHALKTPEDGPFDCQEDVAERLVSLGVAEYAAKKNILELSGGEKKGMQEDGMEVESLHRMDEADEEQLYAMKMKDLQSLVKEKGLDARDCKRKEDYVNLILSADSDGEDDEEEPPALEGMEPV